MNTEERQIFWDALCKADGENIGIDTPKTKKECKVLLEKMIAEVRKRINEEKRGMKEENCALKIEAQ